MMKNKALLISIFLIFNTLATFSQQVELHYDFGKLMYEEDCAARPPLTSTVQMFHPDRWGSTFFFVDFDYGSKGVFGAYWEIARELQFWKPPVSIHIEYNGGLNQFLSFNHSYLGGATYTFNNENFTAGATVSAMYKYIQNNSEPHNFQLTGTWYLHFGKGMGSFIGFIDCWREVGHFPTSKSKCCLLTEPQLWFNFNKVKGISEKFNLSLGTEIECSYNFAAADQFLVIPTVALKWTFN